MGVQALSLFPQAVCPGHPLACLFQCQVLSADQQLGLCPEYPLCSLPGLSSGISSGRISEATQPWLRLWVGSSLILNPSFSV